VGALNAKVGNSFRETNQKWLEFGHGQEAFPRDALKLESRCSSVGKCRTGLTEFLAITKKNCGAAHNNTVLLVCFIGEMLGQITKAML